MQNTHLTSRIVTPFCNHGERLYRSSFVVYLVRCAKCKRHIFNNIVPLLSFACYLPSLLCPSRLQAETVGNNQRTEGKLVRQLADLAKSVP